MEISKKKKPNGTLEILEAIYCFPITICKNKKK